MVSYRLRQPTAPSGPSGPPIHACVSVSDGQHLPGDLGRSGLGVVVVLGVVPAVHEEAGDRDGVGDGQRGAHAHVVIRRRPGKQQRSGVVPVVGGLGRFGADRRVELADVDLHAAPDRRQHAGVRLLHVLQRAVIGIEGVDPRRRRAEPDVGAETDPPLLGRQEFERGLEIAERELVVVLVEVAKDVLLGRRLVAVVGVVRVEGGRELHRAQELPRRRRRRGRHVTRLGGVGRRGLGGRLRSVSRRPQPSSSPARCEASGAAGVCAIATRGQASTVGQGDG